jgi:hypothetical protein
MKIRCIFIPFIVILSKSKHNIFNKILNLKKAISILLSCLFLFNCCGYIFAFYQLSYIFKEEAAERITRGCMPEEISVIEDSIDIEKLGSDEIKVGEMKYDIVKKELKNGKLLFYCLSDEKETALDQILINHIEKNTGTTGSVPIKNILRSIFSDLLVPEKKHAINYLRIVDFPILGMKLYQNPRNNVPTHPPELS